MADIKHHVPSLIETVSGASGGAPSQWGRRLSVGEMLRVLARSSQRLGSPPQTTRPLCICQTGNIARPEAGEGGRQSCPPSTQTGVSTPGRRRAEGPYSGSCFLFTGTCTAISRHAQPIPYTHTSTISQPSPATGNRRATPVFGKNRGCYQDKITLDRKLKVLHLGSIHKWHSEGA